MAARTRKGYAELLNELQKANAEFRKAFREIGSWRNKDKAATAEAKKKLDEFHRQLHILFGEYLQPLSNKLLAGDLKAVDDLLEFLAVDVPAFQTGYTKEWYYGKLKKLPLSESQMRRLHGIALARCASDEYRREDSELRRLMIRLADRNFLEQIAAIPSKQGSRIENHKLRMIQVILHGRKDLRPITAPKKKEKMAR